jgi:hypothetical protein
MDNDNFDIDAVAAVAQDFINAYRAKIKSSEHYASGALNDSLTSQVWLYPESVTVTISGEHYAKYLENGTRPHFPPIDAILQWIRVKPVLPRPDKHGRLPSERSLAFLIARKISRVGTPATNVLQDTLTEFNFTDKLKQTIQDELNRQIGTMVEQSFWRAPKDMD